MKCNKLVYVGGIDLAAARICWIVDSCYVSPLRRIGFSVDFFDSIAGENVELARLRVDPLKNGLIVGVVSGFGFVEV